MKDDRYTPPRVIVTFTLEAGDQGNYVTDDLRNWVYSRFQILPSRLIGRFSEWNVEIGPGNVDIKIEDRRPWWRRVLLGALMVSLLMVGCGHPPAINFVDNSYDRFVKQLVKCGDLPMGASDVEDCIRPAVLNGRRAGVADCGIQTALVLRGFCKSDVLRVLAEDRTPQTNHYDGCDDWGDPCGGETR